MAMELERPLLEGEFNDIVHWNYSEVPQVLGRGTGIKVTTKEEVGKGIGNCLSKRGSFWIHRS